MADGEDIQRKDSVVTQRGRFYWLLKNHITVDGDNFNRWRVPPASVAIHLCIGSGWFINLIWHLLYLFHSACLGFKTVIKLRFLQIFSSVCLVCIQWASNAVGRSHFAFKSGLVSVRYEPCYYFLKALNIGIRLKYLFWFGSGGKCVLSCHCLPWTVRSSRGKVAWKSGSQVWKRKFFFMIISTKACKKKRTVLISGLLA